MALCMPASLAARSAPSSCAQSTPQAPPTHPPHPHTPTPPPNPPQPTLPPSLSGCRLQIDYAEFVAATLGHSYTGREEFVRTLFSKFDADNSGYVSASGWLVWRAACQLPLFPGNGEQGEPCLLCWPNGVCLPWGAFVQPAAL